MVEAILEEAGPHMIFGCPWCGRCEGVYYILSAQALAKAPGELKDGVRVELENIWLFISVVQHAAILAGEAAGF